jgi:tetratricopeptide (TPR) repeat protein
MGLFGGLIRRARARPRRLLVVVAVLAVGLALGGPHLRAWYHLHRARRALARYRNAAAAAHAERCLAVWPGHTGARLVAARAARRTGDVKSAEEHLREAQRRRGPGDEEVIFEWALFRASLGDLDDQVEDFLLAQTERGPERALPAWEALVQGYLRVSRLLDAHTLLDRWLSLAPEDVQAISLRGQVWLASRGHEKAAEQFRRALELDPSRDDDRRGLARAAMEVGRFDEARTQLELLRQRQPDDPDLRVRLARCQHVLGRAPEARALLDEVLAERPDFGPALRTRGQMLLVVGLPAEAEPYLRRAVAVLPNDYLTNFSLGQALQQQKKAEGKRYAERAQEIKDANERLNELTVRKLSERPHDAELHAEVGQLQMKLGVGNAERWLRSALRLNADCRLAHEELAKLYRQKGDAARAAEHEAAVRALPAPKKK